MKSLFSLFITMAFLFSGSALLAGNHKNKPSQEDRKSISADDDSDIDEDSDMDEDSDFNSRSGKGGMDKADKQAKGKANRGSDRAQEMRDRRDERKEIKEEYDATRESGVDGQNDNDIDSADREADSQPAKKPWWKFWEQQSDG